MTSQINLKNQYKKGEMLINVYGWPAIVTEATRGNDPEIINCVEVFGIEHESGSMYTNEVIRRINKAEFDELRKQMGTDKENIYFKGALLDPVVA